MQDGREGVLHGHRQTHPHKLTGALNDFRVGGSPPIYIKLRNEVKNMAESKKSNQADAYMESMKAYQKTYDLLLYLYPILSQFPKFEKFALQSQIKTAIFEMLKSVIRFRKTGTKSHIYNADVELQFIKTLIRLSYDLQYPAMSKHRYEVLSKKMTELGCIIGGIIEAVKNGNWK